MKTQPSASLLRNAQVGLPPAVPRDIHSKTQASFKNWKDRKPRSTELPSAWRKNKK